MSECIDLWVCAYLDLADDECLSIPGCGRKSLLSLTGLS